MRRIGGAILAILSAVVLSLWLGAQYLQTISALPDTPNQLKTIAAMLRPMTPLVSVAMSPAAFAALLTLGLAISFWPETGLERLRHWWFKTQPWGVAWYSGPTLVSLGGNGEDIRMIGADFYARNNKDKPLKNCRGYIENAVGIRVPLMRNMAMEGLHPLSNVSEIPARSDFRIMVNFNGVIARGHDHMQHDTLHKTMKAWPAFTLHFECDGYSKTRVFPAREVERRIFERLHQEFEMRHQAYLQQAERDRLNPP